MDEIDCVVIGAGVIGLAIARALAQSGRETLILEKETLIGSGVSSRNSEVIHAGIYYPKDSLKARFCVAGRRNLYAYCAAHKIAHVQCGKLIVATSVQQIPELEAIKRGAEANGIDDLTWLNTAEIGRLEPTLKSAGALLSPSTGIIDSYGLMLALRGDAEEAGAMIAFGTKITRAAIESRGIAIWTNTGTSGPDIRARLVVNAAGLFARDVTRLIEGFPAAHVPRGWFAKGSYFKLSGRSPFSRLVYPIPEPGGLGVHLTLDLSGQARFGPDVEWQTETEPSELDYSVDPARATRFYAAIRAYWPGLRDGDLEPAYSGVRPKLSGPGQAAADFLITDSACHGVPGLINLFGVESPGLTSSLAIADAVLGLAEEATDAWGK